MEKRAVYLDYSASTPVDEQVFDAMLPYFSQIYGNPSSMHQFARQSERGVEQARETIAEILNCKPSEIVFTSCGSESDNLAIRGAALAAQQKGMRPHLVTSHIEHSAVSRTVQQAGDVLNCDIDFVPVTKEGMVTVEALKNTLRDHTTLVSLMYANNEIGTVLPIAELAEAAHERGALFHTDAVQAAGQLPIDVQQLKVDMMSISGHKFYAPKGVGALYIREGVNVLPGQTGGSHEEGRRAGTLNVPLIVGMAKALELVYAERDSYVAYFKHLRNRLMDGVLAAVSDAELTGSREHRLPGHASFVFKHVDGNQLLMFLDNRGIAASAGSACKTGNPKPSALLMELGYDESWTLGGLRLTVGRQTSEADINYVLDILPGEVEKVRMFKGVSA
ncbi:MAG TPA: cysteine desulfurase family protein [Aggregatilineales bacterium]|nr:cysteine desulfurase family protein [Aggregatilineales bacterium]